MIGSNLIQSVVRRFSNLADGSTAANGAGQVGFLYATAYAGNTVGAWLKGLAGAGGATFLGFLQTGVGGVLRTLLAKLFDFPITPQDFGAVGDGVADDSAAFLAAIVAAGAADKAVWVPATGSGYLLKQPLILGQTGGARMRGLGKPLLKFSSIAAGSDIITMDGGATKRQTVLEDIAIDCQSTGRDGIALTSSDRPRIVNVKVSNTQRDGVAMTCGTGQWLEKGLLDMTIQSAGRHGVSATLSGADGAFINEMVFNLLEIRGVAKVTAGGQAVNWSSTATGGASKFSQWQFVHVEVDAQYTTGTAPSTHCMSLASGVLEMPAWLGGTFENTMPGVVTGGYILQNAGGTVSGAKVVNCITNSGWGNLGIDPNASTRLQFDNVSQGVYTQRGILLAPANSRHKAWATASQANVTGDGTAAVLGGAGMTKDYDPNGDLNASNGVYTSPAGTTANPVAVRFTAIATLTGLTAAVTDAVIAIKVLTGTYAGTYAVDEANGSARNSANNLTLGGSVTIPLNKGDTVCAVVVASGTTKTVGLVGGFNTVSIFGAELIG